MVLIIVLVLMILAATLAGLRGDIGVAVSRDIGDANAFWAAEAGLEQAKAIGQKKRKRYQVIPQLSGSGMLLGANVLSGAIGTANYAVTILNDPDWDNSAHTLQKYVITAVGTAPGGQTQTVSSHAWLLNYASYLHGSHDENGIYFATGDVLDGPVYTDDELHIFGAPGPIFKQVVSTATNCVDYTTDGRAAWFPTVAQSNAMWQSKLVFNVAKLDIQGQLGDHVADIQTETQSGGLELDGAAAADYTFIFKADGSFTYSNRTSHAMKTNYLSALNGTIYVAGNVYAQGTVHGQVTLAAQQAINIVTDLVFASASGTHPTPWDTNFNLSAVSDMLGLMAGDSVNIQGTNSINLHASILIMSNGVKADFFNKEIGNKFINLFGGMSQYQRGGVGQATSPWHGFHKNYKFDQRYVSDGPPCFPPSLYQFDTWK